MAKPSRSRRPRKPVQSPGALHAKCWAVMTFASVLGMNLTYDDARRIAERSRHGGPGATVVTDAAAGRFIDSCRHGVGV